MFEGVPLIEVLKAAGLSLTPDERRGPALEYHLIVEAADEYRVLFALPELSPARVFPSRNGWFGESFPRPGRPPGG